MERIFRFYPDPSSGPEDIIRIDKRIDEFLKKHFDQYNNYFHHPLAKPRGVSTEELAVYNYYSHLREDHQFDDLTVLGIMKK